MTAECVPDRGFQTWSLGGLPIVTPPAEIDAANAEAFGAVLIDASRDQATIIVDMTYTEFCDSSGVTALASAVRRARAAGGEVRLVVGSPAVRRVLAVTGMDSVFAMFDRLHEAIAAARPA